MLLSVLNKSTPPPPKKNEKKAKTKEKPKKKTTHTKTKKKFSEEIYVLGIKVLFTLESSDNRQNKHTHAQYTFQSFRLTFLKAKLFYAFTINYCLKKITKKHF